MDRVTPFDGHGQEQDLLLDFRREMQQVHDLRDAGAGDVPEACDLGKVAHLPIADELFEADGERHESGYARQSA